MYKPWKTAKNEMLIEIAFQPNKLVVIVNNRHVWFDFITYSGMVHYGPCFCGFPKGCMEKIKGQNILTG